MYCMVHLSYIRRKKIGRTRASAAARGLRLRECGTSGHAGCRRARLPTEAIETREGCRAALGLALWATPRCTPQLSIVESTADDHLPTLDGDANVCRRR